MHLFLNKDDLETGLRFILHNKLAGCYYMFCSSNNFYPYYVHMNDLNGSSHCYLSNHRQDKTCLFIRKSQMHEFFSSLKEAFLIYLCWTKVQFKHNYISLGKFHNQNHLFKMNMFNKKISSLCIAWSKLNSHSHYLL